MQTMSGEITEVENSVQDNVMGPLPEGNTQNSLKPDNPTAPKPQQKESSQQVPGASLLSAVLATNIGLLGIALVSGGALRNVAVGQTEVLLFLTIMMLLALCWILFYVSYAARHKHLIVYRDTNAGPVWLRGGLLLFAAGSFLLHLFKIGYHVGSKGCQHPIAVVFSVTQIAFLVAQTYFLWVHCKSCIVVQRDIARCGLALLLTSNLMLWVSAVTDEFIHQTDSDNLTANQSWIIQDDRSRCHCNSSICRHLLVGSDYLYPFNIEYNLFASTMVYVMWKNVGRLLDQHVRHNKSKFYLHGFPIGLVLGVVMLVVGLAIFIVYQITMGFDEWKVPTLTMYYIFNIVLLSLMSMATLLGSFIYKLDERTMDHCKNPTRSLEVHLLLGTAIGQFSIAYFSIVAVVFVRPHEPLAILNLTFALITIIQHALQNIFIVEGLYRQPFIEGIDQRSSHSKFRNTISLLYVHPSPSEGVSDQIREPTSRSNNPQTQPDNVSPAVGQEVVTGHVQGNRNTHGCQAMTHAQLTWKRKFLKEITLFLLPSNIILWIILAFGARSHFTNGCEKEFYGFHLWASILNFGLPLGIFYRMHSAVSLFHVYLKA